MSTASKPGQERERRGSAVGAARSHSSTVGEDAAVVVAVRVRAFNKRESAEKAVRAVVRMKNEEVGARTWVRKADGKEKEYSFDYCWQTHSEESTSGLGNYVTQDDVFQALGVPIVKDALEGRNVCLLAYGQTGAGKTYSMLGKERSEEARDQGIVPRACTELFARCEEDRRNPLVDCNIDVRVVEIYMDKVNDLLAPKETWAQGGRKLRRLPNGQGYTVDSIKVVCESYADVQRVFETANKNRTVGSTALNDRSSRAHTIFTITYRRTEKASADATSATTITSCINLVDLAGSERTAKAKTTGDTLKEGVSINKGLSCLGKCIQVVSEGKEGALVPCNESVLTRLLQGSMINGRVVMIAALSPADSCVDETIGTLEFAKRMKHCRIKCDKNVTMSPLDELRKQKVEMERSMQLEIDRLKSVLAEQGLPPNSDKFLVDVESAARERRRLLEERDQVKAELEAERRMAQQLRFDLEELRQRTALQELEDMKDAAVAREDWEEAARIVEELKPLRRAGTVGSSDASPTGCAIPMTARRRSAYQECRMFCARASLSLDFLVSGGAPSRFQQIPLEVTIGKESDTAPPQVVANIYQWTPLDQPASQREFVPGSRLDFVVHIIGASGVPERFSEIVYCHYVFKSAEGEAYKTPEVKNSTAPTFDFKKRFAFPKVDEKLMNWFKQEGVLTFELIGIAMP